jgi:ketosteroid isomerase-like protein
VSQANKALAKRWIDAVTAGDVEAFRFAMAEDGHHEVPGTCFMSGIRTRDEASQAIGLITSLTKNGLTLNILSMTAEDDRVSAEAQGECELLNGTLYNNRYHFLFVMRGDHIVSIKEFVDTKLVDEVLGPLMMVEGAQ